jgi:hypothetical protein
MSTSAFYVLRLKAFLTPKDLGDLAGYTKAQMCNLARTNEIPGTRVNPGRKHYRFADTPEIRKWCDLKKAERDRPRIRQSTAGKTQRKWQAKIDRLIEILEQQEPVGKDEKEVALGYFDALLLLMSQRMVGLREFPLIEGVHALDRTLFFRYIPGTLGEILARVNVFRSAIKTLPIRPEARPHSAAASAKSQTKH